MDDHRLPKIVMYSELSSGYRESGAPSKRYKDSLKRTLSACDIDVQVPECSRRERECNNECLDRFFVCDEEPQCDDGSHEKGCEVVVVVVKVVVVVVVVVIVVVVL
ncbi:hypothetical protein ElyMa_004795600 [Elysia marginata]|uniref:FZ domain-containing protein n=1 Tax=Elysia marginata TaxID=1093978 RepID=A0AAV4IIR6_9GAST|nr:hypothetical protein ElyMa_004795600 [Elysia marginata]